VRIIIGIAKFHLTINFPFIYVVYLNSVFLPGSGKFDHKFQKVQMHMGMTRGDAIKEYKLIGALLQYSKF
jgi:hypothetical protein